MKVRQFFDSGIDLSWNKSISLYCEKFPPTGIIVFLDELEGFPDKVKEVCQEKFCKYLDCEIVSICASTGTANGDLQINIL